MVAAHQISRFSELDKEDVPMVITSSSDPLLWFMFMSLTSLYLIWTWDWRLNFQFAKYCVEVDDTGKWATPKGVLRVMDVQVSLLTSIFLQFIQKYWLAKYLPDSSSEDGGAKALLEQLEVQRQLQLRIEARGKYLKKIIEEQQRLGGVLSESDNKTDA
ncbi:hypothetical protein L6452_05381 [Arctium lappa]|uniref:Uncharacterized protein n=1 Tax=Arctium lappa TaxID=4217 RepID=A0ACB9EFP0_ARCLA|nr:hypothetical protein L6452_05381 [Arctium lappa]